MANQLTHALLAGAVMALLNPLFGMEPISWNTFLAGIIGMAMNLDSGEHRVAGGSPVGHSLGFGIVVTYLAGTAVYVGHAFAGWDLFTGMVAALAIGVGIFTHLAAEYLTGQQIFTLPNNMKVGSWLRRIDAASEGLWGSWNRAALQGNGMKDFQVNGISMALIILVIGIF